MTTTQELSQAIADIKDTPSEKVEYGNSTESMGLVVDLLYNLLAERGIPVYENGTELSATNANESLLAYIKGEGLFYHKTGAAPAGSVSYNSSSGGKWVLDIGTWGALKGTPKITGLQDLPDNDEAVDAGLSVGNIYHTAGVLKIVI